MTRAVAVLLLSASAAIGHADQAPVSVSLAIPSRDGTRRLAIGSATRHFHVLLSNHSDAPQRIWDDAFSWGYYALSFELLGENGAVRVIRKKVMDFTVNVPDWWTVEPHSHLVLDVHLGDRRVWEGVPRPVPSCDTVRLRAVFEVKPDAESEKEHVWTGRVVSDIERVMLCE